MVKIERKKPQVFIGALVPPQMKEAISNAANSGKYLNESDFIRTAVRNLLKQEALDNQEVRSKEK